MSSTTRINKTNQEEVKMRKLIVEAPELKDNVTLFIMLRTSLKCCIYSA